MIFFKFKMLPIDMFKMLPIDMLKLIFKDTLEARCFSMTSKYYNEIFQCETFYEDRAVYHIMKAKQIGIYYSYIKTLTVCKKMTDIHEIMTSDLECKLLKEMTNTFNYLYNLKKLLLFGMGIEEIKNCFVGLPNLEVLDLSFNRIDFNNFDFSKLSIKKLNISFNSNNIINDLYLPTSLVDLNIKGLNLSSLDMLYYLPHLKHVSYYFDYIPQYIITSNPNISILKFSLYQNIIIVLINNTKIIPNILQYFHSQGLYYKSENIRFIKNKKHDPDFYIIKLSKNINIKSLKCTIKNNINKEPKRLSYYTNNRKDFKVRNIYQM